MLEENSWWHFVSHNSPRSCVFVCLTSSWTRCSRFLYVFWTSSLVPSTPYHIMFLVRLLQEGTAGRHPSTLKYNVTKHRNTKLSYNVGLWWTFAGLFLRNLVLHAWNSLSGQTALQTTIPMSLSYRCHGEEASQRRFVIGFVDKTKHHICRIKSKTDLKPKSEWISDAVWFIRFLNIVIFPSAVSF